MLDLPAPFKFSIHLTIEPLNRFIPSNRGIFNQPNYWKTEPIRLLNIEHIWWIELTPDPIAILLRHATAPSILAPMASNSRNKKYLEILVNILGGDFRAAPRATLFGRPWAVGARHNKIKTTVISKKSCSAPVSNRSLLVLWRSPLASTRSC